MATTDSLIRDQAIAAMTSAVWPDGVWSAEAETMLDALVELLDHFHEAAFLGGSEHHCINEQGCCACAVSRVLASLRRPAGSPS